MTFLSLLFREKEYSVLCIYMLVIGRAAMKSLLNIRNILFLKIFLELKAIIKHIGFNTT